MFVLHVCVQSSFYMPEVTDMLVIGEKIAKGTLWQNHFALNKVN